MSKTNNKPLKRVGSKGSKRSSSLDLNKAKSSSSSLGSKIGYEDIFLLPATGIPPELFGEMTFDCCVLVIFCAKHNKIAITKGKASWLPYVAVKSVDTWTSASMNGCAFILGHGDVVKLSELPSVPFSTPELIEVCRIQVPQQPKYATRLVYIARVNNKVEEFDCCKDDKKIEWIDRKEIKAGLPKAWGPEPYMLVDIVSQKQKKKTILEFSINDALFFRPRDPPRGREEQMLKSAGIGEREITRIYLEFVEHCFPCLYMSQFSFTNFMLKIGWNKEDLKTVSTFRAFNYTGSGHITFYELLLGIAAMEQATHHGGEIGVVRCGYIFRYYDSDSDGSLDYDDIKRMTADIFIGKQMDTNEKEIEKDATFRMETLLKLKKTDKVQFSALMTVIANLSFRGTSTLFRSTVRILDFIKCSRVKSKTDVGRTHPLTTKKRYRGTCLACKRKVYKLSTFSVRIDYTGRVIDPKNLKVTEKKDINWTKEDPLTEQFRLFCVDTLFNPSSLPNGILDILRQFDAIQKKRINAMNPNAKELNKLEPEQILNAVQTICKKAEEQFDKETRCVRVSSPVYVLGDIHGNIADLLTYERNIWRLAPGVTPCNYLFLGDYVDRGEYGVEVVCYLFALKILAPERFYLCRGNHEVRSIQKCFTFYKECFVKYGNKVGPLVFEACNRAFDRMPICAIIDDNIYGAHGGIPTSVTRIDELMKIPRPLQEPENESPAAWEIMWNDPMNTPEFNDLAEFMKIKTDKVRGFLTNSKRGTAFYYSDEAVDNFLRANNLQYILRGHEVMPLGYKFHMNGKVITVFSSSRYCGGTNESACIFVDNEEIRVLRFETHGELKE